MLSFLLTLVPSPFRSALEACGLPAKGVPSVKGEPKSPLEEMLRKQQFDSAEAEETMWKFRKKKKTIFNFKKNSLVDALGKQRDFALEATEKFQYVFVTLLFFLQYFCRGKLTGDVSSHLVFFSLCYGSRL